MTPTTPSLRPLSCCKALLRQTGLQKPAARSMTTYFNKPQAAFHKKLMRQEEPRKVIKVIAPPPSTRKVYKEPLKDVTEAQLAILDPTGSRTNLFSKTNTDAAKVGDILLVRLKNGDPFAGVCINIRRRGIDTGILLRNELTRVGVEMWFKIYSPNVEGVEVVQRKEKRARRARLTYMRKPKHDIGSVQNIVLAYQKSRGAIRGRADDGPVGHENKGGKRKVKGKK
ncbi:mitochondrial ribosomal protein-like protein [Amylocarpus encephaloides]|uniref:Mitochondrial ribosomal protein-like protein n=1 Tax=Amylocarpus encephaloides TaxID=45428 RepID=A0A9P7YEB4_9HELO|nr:mitochondrial ribosomal protein-like protein [Amylocarpus encephaloides]